MFSIRQFFGWKTIWITLKSSFNIDYHSNYEERLPPSDHCLYDKKEEGRISLSLCLCIAKRLVDTSERLHWKWQCIDYFFLFSSFIHSPVLTCLYFIPSPSFPDLFLLCWGYNSPVSLYHKYGPASIPLAKRVIQFFLYK